MSSDDTKDDGEAGDRPVAVLVSESGRIVAQNEAAETLLGEVVGEACAETVGKLEGATALPCASGCAARAGDDATLREVDIGDRHFTMCCVAGVDCYVTTLIGAPESTEPWERPTPRELEVLVLVARGLTDGRIAEELGIGEKTVRTHVEHLRHKMHVRSRAALVARAFRKQLL